MCVSGNYQFMSLVRVNFTQIAETPHFMNIHAHVHQTQVYKTPYTGVPMICHGNAV